MSTDDPTNSITPDDRRNVVLVTVDSLRADHCSYWGYDRETTSTLDRMAEEGFVFEQAISPGPSTYESMPVPFTDQHMMIFQTKSGSEGQPRTGKRNALNGPIQGRGPRQMAAIALGFPLIVVVVTERWDVRSLTR